MTHSTEVEAKGFLMIDNDLIHTHQCLSLEGEVIQLSLVDKLVWSEIRGYCTRGSTAPECHASNEYFSTKYGVHRNTISKAITKLKKAGILNVKTIKLSGKDGRKNIYTVNCKGCLIGPKTTEGKPVKILVEQHTDALDGYSMEELPY